MGIVKITVTGTVQGVGFRPFVYRTAVSLGIRGEVRNDASGVRVLAAGTQLQLNAFISSLRNDIPPLAQVRTFEVEECRSCPEPSEFRIRETLAGEHREIDASSDIATCDACLEELFDPSNRRYRHPFINCTDCGPRFSLIHSLPYDRSATTMASFELCAECTREYGDPIDRRFHAQPVCCHACGPRLSFTDRYAHTLGNDDPIQACCSMLRDGGIVAVKGIGGYHLACRADCCDSVLRLRRRKQRDAKPFALMVRDVPAARQIGRVCELEARLLSGVEHPIVLVAKRPECSCICPQVAPGLPTYGLMLPYTPIHHLLFREGDFRCLVMTSANRSDQPMVHRDEEARENLGEIADAFLSHDRGIHVRIDDSIARVAADRPVLLRRARGYVPQPLPAPRDVTGIIAWGGILKSSVTVGRGTDCYVSQYVGVLENLQTVEALETTARHLLGLLGVEPRLSVTDLHPGGLLRQVLDDTVPVVSVQHHHAHAAACMAENGIRDRAVCVVYDGAGYGTDGTVWGSEIMIADYRGFTRFAHLSEMPMPGGDQAVLYPWRMAMGALYGRQGDATRRYFDTITEPDRQSVLDLLRANVSCPLTSGMGRLFDALSALLGISTTRRYEGEPAIALEAVAQGGKMDCYDAPVCPGPQGRLIDGPSILLQAVEDFRAGQSPELISGRFHNTIARVTADMAALAAQQTGTTSVCLSGGCFQNALLMERTCRFLQERGLVPLRHRCVPPNDESISYGQAVVAGARRLERS